jgi:hypothetical protein
MSLPRFDKPVYFLRSRGGEVLGPFTLREIIDQLNAHKITNDGEIRRQGWEVLEKEELWGKIKDFRINGHGGPTGRLEVAMLKAKAKTVWRVGITLLIIIFGVFIGMFFIPFHEAELKMDEAKALAAKAKEDNANFQKRLEADVAAAKKLWSVEFEANLKKWEADKAKDAAELAKTSQTLLTTEIKLTSEKANVLRIEGESANLRDTLSAARKYRDKAQSDLLRLEKEYLAKLNELNGSFEKRVTQAESRLKLELESVIERYKASSKNQMLRPLDNFNMARVLPSTSQGEGKLVLLVAQRPDAGTKLELFDGQRSLRVTVMPQQLAPPMMIVEVDPGQAGSASSLGFLGIEVLMRTSR